MSNLTIQQKMLFIILGIIVTIILVVYVFTRENSTVYSDIEYDIENDLASSNNVYYNTVDKMNIVESKIIVHVAGQVENEGIVELPQGARINDAIKEAGGVTTEADLQYINLASFLQDGQKVYIPSKDEVENGALFGNETNGGIQLIQESNTTGVQVGIGLNGKININKAPQSELEMISGIGPSTALKIINYRKENGNFNDIEDIRNVPGIGEAKFESIKDSITV